MGKEYCSYYNSPLGFLEIKANETEITGLNFTDSEKETMSESLNNYVIAECIRQLDEYFQGNRTEFTLKLSLSGTVFQNKVWNELLKVPYGNTASYKDIAQACGNPKAVRAVGGANHNNRIAIVIPCHRIVGSNGKLTGYASGLWRKEWLLRHEGIIK